MILMVWRLRFLRDRLKNKKNGDRLRNRLFRWLGVVPSDDFLDYVESVHTVLSAYERFCKSTSLFCNVVAEKLGIRFDGERVTSDDGKSEREVELEYRDRGMI